MKKERESGIELFRIISMLLIIMGHTVGFGIFHDYSTDSFNFNYHFLNNAIGVLPNVAVAMFILTTGTFISKYRWNFKKIALLHGEISFYGWFILIVSLLFFKDSAVALMYPENIANCITPVTSQANWFASTYVVTMLLFPVIQSSLSYLHEKTGEYRKLMVCSAILFLILGISRPSTYFVTDLLWMIYLIFLGDYLETTRENDNRKASVNILTGIGIAILTGIASALCASLDALHIAPVEVMKYVFLNRYSPFSLLAAVYLIRGARKLRFKSVFINRIAKTSFAVYLIHEHAILKPILWNDILNIGYLADNNLMIVSVLIITFIIFAICSLIDLARIRFIEKPYEKFLKGNSRLNIAGYLDFLKENASTRQNK